ncbi:FAD-dependent monooxygenase [Acidisarcina polymorpha]|nr:FAD-dependent monooxygenase [Acidisarcina polymorpha]
MEQVLVIGAGPVGLTCAAKLARYGVHVRIIDRSPHQSTESKALAIWSRTLELMDRMGCTPAFLENGLHCHGASFHNGKTVLGHHRFDNVASPYNFGLMIPQVDTERLLIEHLQSFGVTVERQVELTLFGEAPDHVEARLKHADGHEEAVQTSWLIGCDGAHSTLRNGLGFSFEGVTDPSDWLLADIRLEGDHQTPSDQIAAFLHPDGPFALFPMAKGRTRIIAGFSKSSGGKSKPNPTLQDVQDLTDKRVGRGWLVTDPVWLANFYINERKVSEYSKGRIFLAGDAAHIHSPAGGQGMNTGMQDSINLAWKLALVVREEASPRLLDTYTPERSEVGAKVLHNATLMTELGTLKSPIAQATRDAVMRFMFGFHSVQEREATSFTEIELDYSQGLLTVGARAGGRFSPRYYDGPPPGIGNKPRFVLFTSDYEQGAAFASRFPGLLDPTPRISPDRKRLLLVRPDGYVGLSATDNDWAAAEEYLRQLVITG